MRVREKGGTSASRRSRASRDAPYDRAKRTCTTCWRLANTTTLGATSDLLETPVEVSDKSKKVDPQRLAIARCSAQQIRCKVN